jgi:putative transcriptional regulator
MKYEKLYNKRIEKGFTHKIMAELLDISKPYYCQIENGKRTLSYEMAYKISKILDTKPDELFYEAFKK